MEKASSYCDDIQEIYGGGLVRTLLLLGGYGSTGMIIARILLRTTSPYIKIIIAGRSIEKATKAVSELNTWNGSDRCSAASMDASQPLQFSSSEVDLVIVALPSTYSVENIARACIAAEIDYLNMNYSTQKLHALKSLENDIKNAGCCFITDCGFHPGLPAAIVRFAALQGVDRLKTATVALYISLKWDAYDICNDTKEEFLTEMMNFVPSSYYLGHWKTSSILNPTMIPIEFGEDIGTRQCIAMDMTEMHELPVIYSDLQETGVYMAGFNLFVDLVLMPLVMVTVIVFPCRFMKRFMSQVLYWGLKVTAKEPYVTILKTEVTATNAGQQVAIDISVRHDDGYFLTAAAVTACVLQYLDGFVRKPGLRFQGTLVEPTRFMKDIEKMGVDVKSETSFQEDPWVTSLVLSDL